MPVVRVAIKDAGRTGRELQPKDVYEPKRNEDAAASWGQFANRPRNGNCEWMPKSANEKRLLSFASIGVPTRFKNISQRCAILSDGGAGEGKPKTFWINAMAALTVVLE